MSRSINRVTLTGNLGKDPETKVLPSGSSITSFSLGVGGSKKSASGEWENVTYWVKIAVFGKTAEFVQKYVHKGSAVGVDGELRTRSWEGEDGKKNSLTEVVADEVVLLGGGGGEAKSQTQQGTKPTDDDLPF